jgi:hypothetical protein
MVRNSEICRIFATDKRHRPSAEFDQAESSGQGGLSSVVDGGLELHGGRYAAEADQ